MKWHSDLIAQFDHQNVNPSKEDMLLTIFGSRLPEIMETAVIEYLKEPPPPKREKWFPSVGQLQKHVDAAQLEHDRGVTNIRTVWQVQNLSQDERDKLDGDMFEYEMARNGFEL